MMHLSGKDYSGLVAGASEGEGRAMQDKIKVTFEYAGDTFPVEVPSQQHIEGAWHRALTKFGIQPADASNLALFRDGQEVSRDQSFEQAGVVDGDTLRIRPRVQRNG
jgi:hypothetical protein